LKKLIIFLTTKEFENDKIFSADIKAFAHSLGKKPIDIDKLLTIDLERVKAEFEAEGSSFRDLVRL